MNMDYRNLKYQVIEKIGLLTINRPEKLNALNRETLFELKALLIDVYKIKGFQIRGLILTGEGEKSFIAGADILEMTKMTEEEGSDFGRLGQEVTMLLEKFPLPVIAAVNGHALGGGLEMALSCDFILAAKRATFGLPEVKIGLIPGFGGTQRLSKIIGRNKAKEMIFTGRHIDAEEALKSGLALRVCENKEKLLEESFRLMHEIKNNSPLAISVAKKSMNLGNDLPNENGLSFELEQFSHIFKSNDMKEGTEAFLEKRLPQFKGN